ncbi:MAG TPA: NAD(P)H-hydrate epimerase [Planctomycetaceae bacterium]|nr:NAD(P)H-hydrate epimerase [Planctomycetaceae bacterium]
MPERTMTRREVREIDQRAIREFGLPGVVLMENAGRGAAELLLGLGARGPVVVCAGKGNNGGDGFVIARHLENRGLEVRVLLFCDPAELRGDAAINYRVVAAAGTPLRSLAGPVSGGELDRELAGAEWIVDALLGTGTQGTVREPYSTAIESINRTNARVLAVDLPSGLDCDTGQPLGRCVRADHTATFVARKAGFDAPGAAEWTGTVHVIDIGVPRVLLRQPAG